MKTIHVTASSEYDVKIGAGLLDTLGSEVAKICKGSTVAIISDSNVWPLYGEKATSALLDAGFRTVHFVFPAGEGSKNGSTYLSILNFLAKEHVTRSDCVIALGGGVVGDITGFAAATFLRGISYIQVPTTLLAAVDSSVGGKTAIDLEAGKNLAGAFCQPKLVLCDTNTLNTLPQDIFRDGCAEVIKYGVLYDPQLFDNLQKAGIAFDRESVIARCVELKRDVIMQDEFDTGERQKLNLGHTIGHAIEAMSEFQITHGMAVAAGMAIVTKAAVQNGLCSESVYQTLVTLLKKFELPVTSRYTAHDLYQSALSDKKRLGSSVNLIVPREIGNCEIIPVRISELQSFIKAGL